ncbi:hypothetical protein D9M68_457340 [compost metagenome]
MKLIRYFLCLTLTGLLFCNLRVLAQQQDSINLNRIISKVKALAEAQPIEKVYLHFDKPYYAVADTMWFKAYVTIEQNVPSPFSKIVYVEVFNAKDSLVKTVKLPVLNSVAYGNIPLPMQQFKQGNYYIRAYTRWMLNFDDGYFFTKTIPIGEAIDKELITNVNFTSEEADKGLKTTARIQFKGVDKRILANKTVNWTIYSAGDVVTKGKGTTDAKGFLSISISRKENELITRGNISASVNINEKETVTTVIDLKQVTNQIDFQFFPEGGIIIGGVPNHIGLKAVSTNGLGVDFKGVILTDDQQEVSVVSSGFAGMASFFLTPEEGKNYTAKITFKDGSVKSFPVPKANPSAIGLQISSQTPSLIDARILASSAYLTANQGKSFFVVAQNNNVICYAAKLTLNSQVVNIKIPKTDLPSGILQITLFSADNTPLSERLVFVLQPNLIHLTLKTDQPAYKPRQKVKVNINAAASNLPVSGDFSISVVDEQKVPYDEFNETSILSSLLLTSDLKGYIEKPNYYFIKTDEKKLADMDKLMLTQGYRKFTYKEILADKYPTISYLPEQGMSLSGTLRDLTGMPVRKGTVQLMVTGKPVSANVVTSNTGVFNFQNLNFPDSSQVVISAKYNPNAANLMIIMDGTPIPAAGKNKNLADEVKNIDTVLSSYLSNSQKQYRYLHTLKTVEIKGTAAKKVSHMDHSLLNGLGNPNHVIDGSVFSSCGLMMLECVKSRITGLTFDGDKFYVTRDYNTGSRIPVQVFINNFPMDASDINNVNPAELESIEVFLTDPLGTIDRTYNSKGVLVINTKKPPVGTKISKQDLMDMIPKKNIITINPMGYSKEREFYSPKYLPNAVPVSSDLRTTIYWNPKVMTDAAGNVSLEFFNADGKGTYRATIEGIDKDGNIGRAVYRYKVN